MARTSTRRATMKASITASDGAYALMRSDNNATIGLATMVGFDRVAALARRCRHQERAGNAVDGHRLLRRHATRYGWRLYHLYQRRRPHRSLDAGQRAVAVLVGVNVGVSDGVEVYVEVNVGV